MRDELLWCSLDEPSGVAVDTGAVIHEVLWDTDMHLAMMRKLVNESCCKYAQKTYSSTAAKLIGTDYIFSWSKNGVIAYCDNIVKLSSHFHGLDAGSVMVLIWDYPSQNWRFLVTVVTFLRLRKGYKNCKNIARALLRNAQPQHIRSLSGAFHGKL